MTRTTKRARPRRPMVAAEVEFDVTDERQVSSLLVGHYGPVVSGHVVPSAQTEPPSLFSSVGRLRTK